VRIVDALARPAWRWGTTGSEELRDLPCDGYVADADTCYWRAVNVAAPPAAIFPWLGQLRVAPYSYDWIDNFGRRSPRQLPVDPERLAVGQRVMTIFTLVAFTDGEDLTILMTHPRACAIFGNVAVTYARRPIGPRQSRLIAKLRVRYPRNRYRAWMRLLLPWGDLLMMRKQLLTLKRLAEGSAAADRAALPTLP
jgi:hypothetical protein